MTGGDDMTLAILFAQSEGKGVLKRARPGPDGKFQASEALAKHDENDVPPEAAQAVRQAHAAQARQASATPVAERR
jgi:cytochrome c-type biogenesis protein CcmE